MISANFGLVASVLTAYDPRGGFIFLVLFLTMSTIVVSYQVGYYRGARAPE